MLRIFVDGEFNIFVDDEFLWFSQRHSHWPTHIASPKTITTNINHIFHMGSNDMPNND